MASKNITVSIFKPVYEEMESIRKEQNISRSAYVNRALIEYECRYNEKLEKQILCPKDNSKTY